MSAPNPLADPTVRERAGQTQDMNSFLRDLQGRAHRAGSDGIRR